MAGSNIAFKMSAMDDAKSPRDSVSHGPLFNTLTATVKVWYSVVTSQLLEMRFIFQLKPSTCYLQ